MLWTIAVVLLVLWALGLVTSYTMGGLIHILLVIAGDCDYRDSCQCHPGAKTIKLIGTSASKS
jgi:hypothetical protein